MAGPTVFPDLNEVLCDLVKGVRPILEEEGNFCGAYLQGSCAVGGADVHSDVDFLVVVHDEVTPAQETRLRALHARFPDSDVGWAQHLEGSYVPKIALRRVSATRTPWLYVDNGSRVMERSDHDDTAVVRWVLREHGVVLAGPEPAELVDQVTATQLRREVLGTMNEWAAQLRADEDGLDNAWKQPYVVTSYCRMLHTLAVGRVTSKVAALHWALGALDATWSSAIQHALDSRPDPWSRVRRPADPGTVARTWAFVDHALAVARR